MARQVERALDNVDLSLPQYRILMLLDEGPTVASGLADYLAVSRPSVTSVVDGLVSRGLVQRRHEDDSDRRRIGLSLTAAGRRLLTLADRAADARLQEIAQHLEDPEQVERAFDGLGLWLEALTRHRNAHHGSK